MRLHLIFQGRDRVLGAALGLSIALHIVLLTMHFAMPDARRWKPQEAIEVVLVNAKTRERPVKGEVLAQASLDRGGTVDERRRAKTPLPVLEPGTRVRLEVAGADLLERTLACTYKETLGQGPAVQDVTEDAGQKA